MKKQLLFLSFFAFCSSFLAQTDVQLVIHHKLGSANYAQNTTVTNNLGNTFQSTLLKYYITKFSVIHDGGQVLPVDDAIVGLVDASMDFSIDLGNLNVTSVEGIKFHIGVHSPVNHEDPSLLPSDHPLAPQSPSMHWGWTSGYRFILFEGMSGPSVNQALELHGLGDENYFETTVLAPAVNEFGGLSVHIDADYTRGVENIDISSGLIVHGSLSSAAVLVANFRDYVYSATVGAGLDESTDAISFELYPNPANGWFMVETAVTAPTSLVVTDVTGKQIHTQQLVDGKSSIELNLPAAGVYFVTLTNEQGQVSRKLVNQ